MEKKGSYRNLKFSMVRGSGYGCYYLVFTRKGKEHRIFTNDSQIWDYMDDDDDKKRREYCSYAFAIIRAYIENNNL